MFAIDLISSAVPTLSLKDRAGKALDLMSEFHTGELPVVEDKNYLGLMEEESLLETEDRDALLSGISLSVLKPAIRGDVHFFEALKIVSDYQLSILPVVDKTDRYAGAITVGKLLLALSEFNGIRQPGGLLILEMKPPDYMLSEIARIAESEDVSLLGVHTLTEPGSGSLRVLLKTNRKNLESFVATLRQLHYNITYRFDEAENIDNLQKNYAHLMNYINM